MTDKKNLEPLKTMAQLLEAYTPKTEVLLDKVVKTYYSKATFDEVIEAFCKDKFAIDSKEEKEKAYQVIGNFAGRVKKSMGLDNLNRPRQMKGRLTSSKLANYFNSIANNESVKSSLKASL